MGESADKAHWRVRGIALIASACAVCTLCLLLYLASRHTAIDQSWRSAGVEVLVTPNPEQHPPPRPQAARILGAQSPNAASPAAPDPVLAQMLTCFSPHREERPECPRLARRPQWSERSNFSVGHGRFDQPPPIDYNAGLTTGERLAGLAHHAPCETTFGGTTPNCARLPPPPPPSRTAEEICEAGGIGPCHPPPFSPAAPKP